ncbi:MAG: diguanylate cyclase [candidate division NC10 bacterium]
MQTRKEVAFAGHQIRTKIVLALVLSSVIPLLILIYILHMYIVPLLGQHQLVVLAMQALTLFTGLLMVAGGYVIWDMANAVVRTVHLISASKVIAGEKRADEIGVLMESFSRMVGTIEQRAGEISQFSARLEAAYKELEQTNDKLKKFSFGDELTGLYNRRFFSVRMGEELSRYRRFNHPLSLILLDVDDFKSINDELGHAAGDETLREIAQLLMKHSRGINVLCRYGGDEFAILLVETSRAGALLYAERVRQALADYPLSHGRRVTASFGVASLPEDVDTTTEDLVRAADEALYAAKRLGKNLVEGYQTAAAAGAKERGVARTTETEGPELG